MNSKQRRLSQSSPEAIAQLNRERIQDLFCPPFRLLITGPSGAGKTTTAEEIINNLGIFDKVFVISPTIQEEQVKEMFGDKAVMIVRNLKPSVWEIVKNRINLLLREKKKKSITS